ncbi:Origin recognition complex, subunit 1 [Coemansia sp. RSA 1200]|nr:Origin recognition complex, subunit 1 [Coemansia sp. RSA 1200]
MPPGLQQNRIADRLEKAVKKAHSGKSKRKQQSTYASDDDSEVVIEWGDRLDSSHGGTAGSQTPGATPSSRRVTRHSGMTNKELYKSVIVNGVEYNLGQAVRVRSPGEETYQAIIHQLWENEVGEKQIVARWLLRKTEMFLGKRASAIQAEDDEVFYSNADDLINPGMIIAPLDVLTFGEYNKVLAETKELAKRDSRPTDSGLRFCRRYFNEKTAFIGDLDWDSFYHKKEMLNPLVQERMFTTSNNTKRGVLGKKAATEIGRAKAASKRKSSGKAMAAASKRTKRCAKRQKMESDSGGSEVSDKDDSYSSPAEESEESGNEIYDEVDEDDVFSAKQLRTTKSTGTRKSRKAAGKVRTPVRAKRAGSVRQTPRVTAPTSTPRRRMRLQDIQPVAAVSTAMLRRASRLGKNSTNTQSLGSGDAQSVYEIARQQLHVSAVPDTLPCREDEFAEIYGHLYNTIEERNSMCMYISGVPGTGKTATVHEVIRSLQESSESGDLPEFQYIELNGMKMTEPAQAYTQLWQAITGDKVTSKHAAQLLEKHFSTPSPRRHSYVVLMDELDLLVTKSQSIMYNFFDWPHRPHAKLVVIAIANTMDLPERMLHHKVSSRLGLTRINFQPYSYNQLMTIVQSRLEGCMAFDSDAVELCARKISAVSGDARRALDVCRRAVEIVEADWKRNTENSGDEITGGGKDLAKRTLVTMMVIDRAVKEMYASGHIAFIQNASIQQKVFLVALRAAIRKAGIPEVSLGDIAFIHRQLCQMHNLTVPSYEQVARICSQLGATRCILTESSILDVHQQVRLAVAEEDIAVALRPDPLLQKISVS